MYPSRRPFGGGTGSLGCRHGLLSLLTETSEAGGGHCNSTTAVPPSASNLPAMLSLTGRYRLKTSDELDEEERKSTAAIREQAREAVRRGLARQRQELAPKIREEEEQRELLFLHRRLTPQQQEVQILSAINRARVRQTRQQDVDAEEEAQLQADRNILNGRWVGWEEEDDEYAVGINSSWQAAGDRHQPHHDLLDLLEPDPVDEILQRLLQQGVLPKSAASAQEHQQQHHMPDIRVRRASNN